MPKMRDTGYCWRPECTYPYESLRSLLGKFMLLNHISLAQVNQIDWYGSSNKGPYTITVNSNLLTKNIFTTKIDQVSFGTILGLSEEQIRFSTIEPFLSNVAYEKSSLRYCPSCLAVGYHSPFHQLEIFSRCPIHQERLQKTCIACHSLMNYVPSSGDCLSPFSCPRCGHVYMKNDRAVVNGFGNEICEIGEYVSIVLPARFGKKSIYEKKIIPSYVPPPESIFKYFNQRYSSCNGSYEREQQMSSYRWADAFRLNIGWLHKTSHYRAPKHSMFAFDSKSSFGNRTHSATENFGSLSFKSIYKSIKRHFRRRYIKPSCQMNLVKDLKRLSYGVHGNVVKSTDKTNGVLAAAYVQLSLHHDYLLQAANRFEDVISWLLMSEHHSELSELSRNIGIPSHIKEQLISRIVANECYSSFIEFLLRALVQRKHGRLVFNAFYRDRRYDSHWLIDASDVDCIKMHLWSQKPSLGLVARYCRKHGF